MALSDDYKVGQSFALLARSVQPLTQQRLQALLSDTVGDDTALASAFRMMLGHRVCVDFLQSASAGEAQLLAVLAIAREGLSAPLVTRIEAFLRGYSQGCGRPAAAAAQPSSFAASGLESEPTVVADFSAAASAAVADEPPTVYAPDPPATGSPAAAPVSAAPAAAAALPWKPILLAGIGLLALIGAVKIPALCEPFGLCDASDSGSKGKDEAAPAPRSGTAGGPAARAAAGAGATAGTPSAPQEPLPQGTAPVAAPPVVVSRPAAPVVAADPPARPSPQPAPRSSGAPLRDEPLW